MLEIWHVIETIGNTMVFFLAGVLTGRTMLKTAFVDYLWTVLVYLVMIVLRLVMLLGLRPLLNLAGERVSLKDLIIMTWGGLRGMVGLALAILVRQDRARGRLSEEDGDRVLFLVSGIAALTLVVNATTSPMLCRFLGLTQAPEARKVLIQNVAKRAEDHVRGLLEELAHDKQASKACLRGFVTETVENLMLHVRDELPAATSHLQELAALVGTRDSHSGARRASFQLLQRAKSLLAVPVADPSVEKLWQAFDARRQELLSTGGAVEAFQFGAELKAMKRMLKWKPVDPQQVKVVREVLLEAVRASYWEQLQQGKFLAGSSEPSTLLNSVDLAKDKCGQGLGDWRILAADVTFAVEEEDECTLRRSTTISEPAEESSWFRRRAQESRIHRVFAQQMRAVQIISAFIQAHRHAQSMVASYFGATRAVDSAEETFVLIESQTEIFEAAVLRSKLSKAVQLKVNTAWQVHRLSQHYRHFVLECHESGVLQGKEAELLLRPLEHQMRALERDRKKIKRALQRQLVSARTHKLCAVDAAQMIQRAFRRSQERTLVQRVTSQVETIKPPMGGAPLLLQAGSELKVCCVESDEHLDLSSNESTMRFESVLPHMC